MKRILLIIFIALTLVPLTRATHLIGGSMSYQQIGINSRGNYTYRVTQTLYRDCQNGITTTVQFEPEIVIGIYNNNTNRDLYNTVKIKLIYRKIVPAPGRTDCPMNNNVCIEKGFYEGFVELDPSTVGYEMTFEKCCRNEQVNLVKGGSTPVQGQAYYCKIPPTHIKNGSPVFTGVPSPFMCTNDTTSFLNTAVDPDGDSLVYYFVKPFGSVGKGLSNVDPPSVLTLKTVNYNPGFNENFPFGSTGYSKVDSFNGLTSYFTTTTGNYVVAIEVAEYRNGDLLGVVRLDLQIIFINCPPNRKPIISGDKGKNFTIEAGSKLCFNVLATDPDNDNLELTGSGNMFTGLSGWKGPLATLSAKNGKGTISSEFCWQTSCEQASTKPYQFAVTVNDDGCPGKSNAVNFTIKVNPFISNLVLGGSASLCQNSIGIHNASNQALGSQLEWDISQGIILSGQFTNSISVKWNGTVIGKVRCREISKYGCIGDWKAYNVTINPSPAIPIITGKDTVCLNAKLVYTLNNTLLKSYWTVASGTLVSNTNADGTITWDKSGNQIIKVVIVSASGCFSDTGFFKIYVANPSPSISGPTSVCPNAIKSQYFANGSSKSSFQWAVAGGTIASGNGSSTLLINWGNEGQGDLSVIETDKHGCVSNPVLFSVKKSYTLESELPKGALSVCEFEKGVGYYLFPSFGTTFIWGITGGSIINPGNSNSIITDWGKAGMGSISVTRTAYDSVNKKACLSATETAPVIINPTPNAALIEGNFKICQSNDTLSYTLNGYIGSTYSWQINGNSNSIKGQGTKTIKIAWNTPGTFTLKVIELSKDSCLGAAVDSIVTVYPKPISNTILGPITICDPNYSSKNYTVNGFAKSTFNWGINQGNIVFNTNTDSINVNWNGNTPAWLKVVEKSEYGCQGDTITQNILMDKLSLEMLVVSVGDPDDRMEINWMNPNSTSNPRLYTLKKRNAGDIVWIDSSTLDNLNGFIEYPLNTDENPFDYQVQARDLCLITKSSDIHTNVWLSGSKTEDPYAIKMQFTPYLGFKNGVSKYQLYRWTSEQIGGYQAYDSFSQVNDLFYKNGLEAYKQCYKILSYENGGNNQQSWSNEICFNFSPSIYIPNAFTPNHDGLNDYFKITAAAIKTFDLKIFDRWGEKLWESKDFEAQGWDAFYKEKPVQLGVYFYSLAVTDFRDKLYQMNGTVHVIR